jgi:hypothetical protein
VHIAQGEACVRFIEGCPPRMSGLKRHIDRRVNLADAPLASAATQRRTGAASLGEALLLPDLPAVKRLLKRLLGGRDESKRFAQMPARERIEGVWIHVIVG